jgi:ABC-type lipoprotein release transport system permease subunit
MGLNTDSWLPTPKALTFFGMLMSAKATGWPMPRLRLCAIGATAQRIRTLVLKDALRLAVFGMAAGAALAAAAAALVRSLLFGVTATDAVVMTAAPVLLLLTALAAAFLPARRAVKIQPMAALRYQ